MDIWIYAILLILNWSQYCFGFSFPKRNGTFICKNQITPYLEYQMICNVGPNQQFTITIEPGKNYDLKCNNINTFDYSKLPQPYLEPDEININYFKIDRCPLTQTSFAGIILQQRVITTRVLAIYNGNYNKVKRSHFLGLNIFNITRLVMNNCSMSRLPVTLFKDLKNLEILHLSENNIRPPKNVFDTLTNLIILYMNGNEMTELPDGIFSKLSSLRSLYLQNNKLVNVSKATFEGLDSLRKLELSQNSLTTLHEDTFEHLKNLWRLHLNNNHFSILPSNLLKYNRQLLEFSLSQNKPHLKAMPEKFLSNLWKLTAVELKQNGLEILPENLFENSMMITNMTLTGNNIVSLPECIFGYQRNLKSLGLSFNKIKRLPARIFENLTSLLDLTMEQNHIDNLPGNIFKKLENLMSLNIRENQLKTLEPLQGLESLFSIDMSRNWLSWEYDCLSPFQNLKNLAILNLRSNRIKHICRDWRGSELALLPNLEQLDLGFNYISEIASFQDINFRKTKYFTLNLRRNRIQRIILNEDSQLTPNNSVRIYVEGNPFNCDCQLLSFIKYLRRPQDEALLEDAPVLTFESGHGSCATPHELFNRTLDSLKLEELSCHYKKDGHCTYVKKPHTLARTVICTDGGINVTHPIPDLGKQEDFEHNHTEMHLSNNFLGELRRFGRISENVTKLYLNGNNLTELAVGDIPSNIEILDLRNNSFVHVNASVAVMIVNGTKLKELWISGNPFACDCDNHLFLSLLESHHQKVKDYHLLKCPNGTDIYQLKLALLCIDQTTNWTPLTVSLILLGLLLFAMWSFTIWYYNNKDTIKIWLHDNVKWSRRFILKPNPPDIDTMNYDVFVSGSHIDNEIIVDEVIFNLEKDGYKVCWHERDWRAGAFILESIEKSIQESQTTLFFVTENFVGSTWSCQEFRLAISTAVERGCFNLIVVLHGDIGPLDDLEPTLRNYLKSNTYLKWEDKSFWGRLRVSLPQRICDVRSPSNQDNNDGQTIRLLNTVEPLEINNEIELDDANNFETEVAITNTIIEIPASDETKTGDNDIIGIDSAINKTRSVSNEHLSNANIVRRQYDLESAEDPENDDGDNGEVTVALLETASAVG